MNLQPTLLSSTNHLTPPAEIIFLHNIIIDRGSKYSVTCIPLPPESQNQTSSEQKSPSPSRRGVGVRSIIKKNTTHKFYRKSTHNTYARRLQQQDGSIIGGKNDDGETGAGQCILRELQRVNFINGIVIVTRYYGGIKLQNDRFKHVIEATKHLIKHISS